MIFKSKRLFQRVAVAVLALASPGVMFAPPISLGFLPILPGDYDFNEVDHWIDDTINGVFDHTPLGAQTVTFNAPTTVAGLTFNLGGSSPSLVLRSDGGARSLTLGGNIEVRGSNGTTITFGSATPAERLDLVLSSDPGTFTVEAGNELRVLNAITGDSLVVEGGGTVSLSGSSTLTGTLSIGSGTTLNAEAENTLSAGSAVTIGEYATLTLSADQAIGGLNGSDHASVTFEGAVSEFTFDGYTKLTVNGGGIFNGSISGEGRLVKAGSGTLTLGGSNSFIGGVLIEGGSLAVSEDTALGEVPESFTSDLLTLNGGILQATSSFAIHPHRGISIGTGGGTFNVDDDVELTYNGVITGDTLTKNGAGTLVLGGGNTYVGVGGSGTIVNAGILRLANSLGDTLEDGADVTLNGSGELQVNENQTIRGLISSSSASRVVIADEKALTINLPDAQSDPAHTSATFAGQIAGDGSFVVNGPGTMIVTGDSLAFGGAIAVENGTLAFGNSGPSGVIAGDIAISGGATLKVNRSDENPLTFSSTVTGAGTFVKAGSSTLVLTGNVSGFTGSVSVADGRLKLAAGASVGAVTVASAGTLEIAHDAAIKSLSGLGATTVSSTKTLTVTHPGTLASAIEGAGNVTFNNSGSGVTTVTVDQTYGGLTTVNAGTLRLGNAGLTGSVAGDIHTVGSGTSVEFNRSDAAYTYAGGISGDGGVQKLNAGSTLTLTGAHTYVGATKIGGGTLKIGSTGSLPTGTKVDLFSGTTLNVGANQTISGFLSSVGASIVLEAGRVLNITLGNSDNEFSGIMSGSGGLAVGASTGGWVVLTNANTYGGVTTINVGGTLSLGNGLSGTGRVSGDIANYGTLVFQQPSDWTFGGVISGSGTVQQGSLGGPSVADVKLTGANLYTGVTNVFRGTLLAMNSTGSATGTSTVNVSGSGVFGGNGLISGVLNIQSGGMVAPGTNLGAPAVLNVANAVFEGGGKFAFQIRDADHATAGVDYSLLAVSGALTINATTGNKFQIELYSLNGSAQGAIPDFNVNTQYAWKFVTTFNGNITGFDPDAFTFDLDAFQHTVLATSFSVSRIGNDVFVNYTPAAVPEPSTWALLAVGLGAVWCSLRRRPYAGKQARPRSGD